MSAGDDMLVLLDHIDFSYDGEKEILKDIHISIEKGEWISILGHNGSGKSTLAKSIVGLLEVTNGRIFVDDVSLSEETAYEVRKKIGIVFQNPDNQFVGVTVRDDIAFGMENLCFSKEEMLKAIDFYADKIGVKELLDKEPSSLSGGQKQRVAIAGILAMQTEIIIFDEATSMLDPYAREDLMKYIKQLHQEGLTIIMITHDIEEALLSDRIIVLKEGKVFLDNDVASVLKESNKLKEAHLELPTALQIVDSYPEIDASWKEYLWESVLKK